MVEEVSITSANINDGKAGPDALPDNPGEVFADSAYRGNHFCSAVLAKGSIPQNVATGMWGRDEAGHLEEPSDYVLMDAGEGPSGRVVPIPMHRSADCLDGADRWVRFSCHAGTARPSSHAMLLPGKDMLDRSADL
ncbi:hypothetical protein [Sphingobium xenophagum]|uniref:Transposase, IS5 family n=1 Tax=Sphingobium xenophagum TaxID=121428 RepID=A0A401J9F3_SPHXE|nr:hypothetical protein [Sphingobium xenophagum]GBH33188.1 transposase, IS5 family [Sphingobium xenophagum]